MQEQPPEQQELSHSMQFYIGLGVGLIPLVLALIALGTGRGIFGNALTLLTIAAILYGLELVAMIVMLSIKKWRFIGYALLTMFLISPVVFFIACVVQITRPA